MGKTFKIGITAVLLLLLLAVAGWFLFPHLVRALPTRVRLYLPEAVLQAASEPLPTALPAPVVTPAAVAVLPTLPLPTPTLAADVLPTFTAVAPLTATTPLPIPSPMPPPLTPSPTSLPAQIRIPDLAVIPQKFNNCGPANLAINLAYHGQPVDQLDIAAQIRPEYDDRNVTPEEMVQFVNSQTSLQATVFSGGDLETLKRLLANGFPVVIEKGYLPNDWQGWMGHYLTLIGYDDAAQELTALDTFLGPWDSSGLRETYPFIKEFWQQFNYTFYVVYQPQQADRVMALLPPELTDPATMWRHSAQIAQAEIETAPQNAYAWFNLGTSLTRLGQLTGEETYFTNAAAAFDQARTIGLPWRMLWYQFTPYDAYLAVGRHDDVLTLANATISGSDGQEEAYTYRGLAYLAQGYPEQARLDFQTALTINPHNTLAQQSLAHLNNE